MIGIISAGGYVPYYKLTGEVLSSQWGGSPKGQRSVANHDEDSITMAIESAFNALGERDPRSIDGLYFCSTTMPYKEKSNSAFIATVLDMRQDVFTADIGGSLRAGSNGIRAGRDAVAGGSARSVIVTSADVRMATPGDPTERMLGDAGASLIIGSEGVIAEIVDIYSTNHEYLDVWRRDEDNFIQSADAKFTLDTGYSQFMAEVAVATMKRNGLEAQEISAVTAYSPDGRMLRSIASSMKIPPEKFVNVVDLIGDAGTANSMLALVYALEKAKPGEWILFLAHSSGADAILFRTTERVAEWKSKNPIDVQVKRMRPLTSYGKYLQFREILPREDIRVWTAAPVLWREEKENYRLIAKRCNKCEAIQYPVRRVCWNCKAKDDMSDVKLNRTGRIFTFAKDHLPPNPDPPTVMVSVDLDGGGRFYTQMTDCDPSKVEIGMEVELTLRKIHEGGGFNNYFWKFRPKSYA